MLNKILFLVPYGKGNYVPVKTKDICFVEAKGNYSMVSYSIANTIKQHPCHQLLKQVEQQLHPQFFVRANHRYLVRIDFIKFYHCPTHWLTLKNNVSFTVGRKYRKAFNERCPILG